MDSWVLFFTESVLVGFWISLKILNPYPNLKIRILKPILNHFSWVQILWFWFFFGGFEFLESVFRETYCRFLNQFGDSEIIHKYENPDSEYKGYSDSSKHRILFSARIWVLVFEFSDSESRRYRIPIFWYQNHLSINLRLFLFILSNNEPSVWCLMMQSHRAGPHQSLFVNITAVHQWLSSQNGELWFPQCIPCSPPQ